MNNGGINRPSLLSGGAQNNGPAPNTGRILADMEGRQVAASSRATKDRPTQRRRVWLWVGACCALLLSFTTATLWWLSSSASQDSTEYSLNPDANPDSSVTGATGHPDAPYAAPSDGAAMIIDAPDSADAKNRNETPPAVEAAAANATPAPAARDARVQRTTAAARPAAGSRNADENLLGTLLGIIKEEESKKKKSAAAPQPQTMDDLIAKIEADDKKRADDERVAFEQVATRKTASTESTIQTQLRACPGANTTKGLECRAKICASVRGRDPACPAM